MLKIHRLNAFENINILELFFILGISNIDITIVIYDLIVRILIEFTNKTKVKYKRNNDNSHAFILMLPFILKLIFLAGMIFVSQNMDKYIKDDNIEFLMRSPKELDFYILPVLVLVLQIVQALINRQNTKDKNTCNSKMFLFFKFYMIVLVALWSNILPIGFNIYYIAFYSISISYYFIRKAIKNNPD